MILMKETDIIFAMVLQLHPCQTSEEILTLKFKLCILKLCSIRWDNVFKNGPGKICGPILNTLPHM